MRKLLFFTLINFSVINCFAQNLIPNPSFENINTVYCGIYSNTDLGYSVNSWHSPTNGSPDLFSTSINQSCWNFQPNSSYPGPIGLKGFQLPRTGNIMVGLFCYTIDGMNQREYIQTQLTTSLTPGNLYTISFFVSLANNTEKYTDKIGAYVSDSPIISSDDQPLVFMPQVSAINFVTDTMNWILVSGTFQATSPANFLTIGNFNYDANTNTGYNAGGGTAPGTYGAYYFIDDVSLIDITTGIEEGTYNDFVNVCLNNETNNLNIFSDNNNLSELIVYDIFSRVIIRQYFSGSATVNTEQLVKGLYVYKIISKNNICKNGKLIIE